MLGYEQKAGERHEYPFPARQFKCNKNDALNQKLLNAQHEIMTNIENAQ